MPNNYRPVATSMTYAAPQACLKISDVLDRAGYGPPAHIAPSAKTCLLVEPASLTIDWREFFESGWKSVDCTDIYSLLIGDTRLHVSLEDRVWMIEATFPESRRPAVVLGLGCSLIVTRSPMAAAQIARLFTPTPLPPFKWLPYW